MNQDMNKLMRARYKAKVVDLEDVPTQYDNQSDFAKPDNADWVRMNIRPAASVQVDICPGKPRSRTTGSIIFQVFSPIGKGDASAMKLADRIKSAFRMVTADGIVYSEPTITTVGVTQAWWQVNVTCPFQYDEIVNTGD